jgi:arabinofuranosyltransferase
VWAGGDFMSGRFFAVPFIAAIAVTAFSFDGGYRLPRTTVAVVGGVGVLLSLLFRFPVPLQQQAPDQITDERAFYAGDTALPRVAAAAWAGLPAPWLRPSPYRLNDHFADAIEVRRVAEAKGRQYIAYGAIGVLGFYAGPAVHIIDPYALTDPFLARLPASCQPCRPGHYRRAYPIGFTDSVVREENLLPDPVLRSLWEDVRLISMGELTTPARWSAIGRRLVP